MASKWNFKEEWQRSTNISLDSPAFQASARLIYKAEKLADLLEDVCLDADAWVKDGSTPNESCPWYSHGEAQRELAKHRSEPVEPEVEEFYLGQIGPYGPSGTNETITKAINSLRRDVAELKARK